MADDSLILAGISAPLSALVSVAVAWLLERRRFYNVAEYASTTSDDLRARIRELLAEGPAGIRRLRRALLARASKIA